jgi:hypothetical protein
LSKFHVNPSTGNPGRCFALKKCRFGGDDEHYASKELAALAYEKFHAHEEIPVLRKSDSEPKKRLEDFAVDLHEPKGPLLTYEQIAEADAKFQNLKKSSSRVMEDFRTPVAIVNNTASTSLRFDGGRAIATLKGAEEARLDGDYPVGDLTQDSETVKRLLETDPELQYINGECATLAWDLYDSYPEHVKSVSEIWVKGDSGSMHVIAELKDGSFIDGLGHWSPSGVLSAWKELMGKDVEMRLGDRDADRKGFGAMFESTKILGKYFETLK